MFYKFFLFLKLQALKLLLRDEELIYQLITKPARDAAINTCGYSLSALDGIELTPAVAEEALTAYMELQSAENASWDDVHPSFSRQFIRIGPLVESLDHILLRELSLGKSIRFFNELTEVYNIYVNNYRELYKHKIGYKHHPSAIWPYAEQPPGEA